MNFDFNLEKPKLSDIAREIFADALRAVDAGNSLKKAVRLEKDCLRVFEKEFDLNRFSEIYAVALGKAALALVTSLDEILREKLTAGVVSAPKFDVSLQKRWQVFTAGHPVPNEASFDSARAAVDLLKRANKKSALVIFLVSGGGSAMMELPCDKRISLQDLQTTNQILVNCGATIAEINALRRRLSLIKGGGLSLVANQANKFTLVVSDTNEGDVFNVASGPTIAPENDFSSDELKQIVEKYKLFEAFPPIVAEVLKNALNNPDMSQEKIENHDFGVLLSNKDAVQAAAKSAREKGFAVETIENLVETPIEEGCREHLRRLIALREKVSTERGVALISGGEFVCPVRGKGIGGRNSEAALRSVLEIKKSGHENFRFAVLQAGTDGIDGNSPAAGAVADETTLNKARELNLDADDFLARSDAYSFFAALNDAIITGATGTNVRDVRIFLAQ